ncbi:alpha-hydroxy acid oxidase [Actinophytocola algeriensis]|uniref:4-hydroxymandelate oxidase n=1 Tax=Actinophytocola algeriensis TaxID=1768010 RepID=A0A7W7QEQ7_9PSEU|nr:alpha-hydroxy acid oxidase [Actinophytocola algeriensis]MBB4912220.1 4-hydroxymandelate oxidase [Actinophytocola algeriensis]MBE1474264.1 4-hydroxymandelate oxidase [Actinophytocola algeriensis]
MTRDDPLTVADVARLAQARLPKELWDYVAGGSGAETTLAANRAALDEVAVLPRVLAGVAAPDPGTRLLGSASSLPLAVAPMAYQRLLHPDGELATAEAAEAAGVPFVVSTLASVTVEEVVKTGATTWFQLYWLRAPGVVEDLVARAEDAGCEALVVTVDVPVMGRRLRDVRNSFVLPDDVVAAHLTGGGDGTASRAHAREAGTSAIAAHTAAAFAPGLGWSDLEWLRDRTSLPLVLKGILDPRDAVRAAGCGVDAVVVSNHGGRQLDGAAPSIAAVPSVVAALAGQAAVYLDSGIRTGTDILRALASGADGVLVGRPVLYGLAADGAPGAGRVLSLLAEEFRDAMTLAGCADVAAVRELSTVRTVRA